MLPHPSSALSSAQALPRKLPVSQIRKGLICQGSCRYNTSADVWSFGILLYELATGKAPYANMSLTKVILTTLHQEAPTLDNVKGRKFSEVPLPPQHPHSLTHARPII